MADLDSIVPEAQIFKTVRHARNFMCLSRMQMLGSNSCSCLWSKLFENLALALAISSSPWYVWVEKFKDHSFMCRTVHGHGCFSAEPCATIVMAQHVQCVSVIAEQGQLSV